MPSHLVRREPAHAVPEEREGYVQLRCERPHQGTHHVLKPARGSLGRAPLATGKLNRPELNARGESRGPRAIDRRATARVMEAEQAKLGLRIRSEDLHPGIWAHRSNYRPKRAIEEARSESARSTRF